MKQKMYICLDCNHEITGKNLEGTYCPKCKGPIMPNNSVIDHYTGMEELATEVASIVYDQSKAKIYSLLELQFINEQPLMLGEKNPKLEAVKLIAGGMIKEVSEKVYRFMIAATKDKAIYSINFNLICDLEETALDSNEEKAKQQVKKITDIVINGIKNEIRKQPRQ